ncbi:hypothetical protein VNO80_08936 [Phaseolus coccineus]|uniref:Uncharacterized protein n=1 Tax=Phaseolus coccineus TaxID=3886 RepID=A0AAN9RHU9_PHACN
MEINRFSPNQILLKFTLNALQINSKPKCILSCLVASFTCLSPFLFLFLFSSTFQTKSIINSPDTKVQSPFINH